MGFRGARRRWGFALAGLLAVALLVAPAWAQSRDVGVTGVLDALGIPCGLLVALVLGAFFWHCLALFLAMRMAGVDRSYGRAVLTFLATVGMLIPVGVVLHLVGPELDESGQAVLSNFLFAGAEITAVKLIYATDLGRAIFGFLTAGLLSTVGLAVLLIVLF